MYNVEIEQLVDVSPGAGSSDKYTTTCHVFAPDTCCDAHSSCLSPRLATSTSKFPHVMSLLYALVVMHGNVM